MNSDEEKYYTPQEVADELKVEARTIHSWLREGQIKGVKVGRLWRIPHSEIERSKGSDKSSFDKECSIPVEKSHNMKDYDSTYKKYKIEVPEYFNFGYDIID